MAAIGGGDAVSAERLDVTDLAAVNAYVALTFTLAQWAMFMAIFPLASKIALFAGQYFVFRAIVVRNIRARQAQADPLAA